MTNQPLPNRLRFLDDTSTSSIQVKKDPQGRLKRVQSGGDEEYFADPQERYAYNLVETSSYLYQWRIGAGGILHPLSPHKVEAHSHPGGLTFHPNGRFAYVTCSHGAICQYHVHSGALIPMSPRQVYADNDPSGLWFDRTGNFACVINPGAKDEYPPNDRVYVYRIDKQGRLNLARQIEVLGASSKFSRAVLDGHISSFTVSGDILGR